MIGFKNYKIISWGWGWGWGWGWAQPQPPPQPQPPLNNIFKKTNLLCNYHKIHYIIYY